MRKHGFVRTIVAAVLSGALVFPFFPGVVTASAAPDIEYIDENGDTQTADLATMTQITAASTTLTTGWYYCVGTVTTGSLTVTGDVHLILGEGCVLTTTSSSVFAPGVRVEAGNSLTIYEEAASTNIGWLTATGGQYGSGIGGGDSGDGGTITINGGTVNAISGQYGSGIGGGSEGDGGTITINGGTVFASGDRVGSGIGGGDSGDGGTITINGGTVNAISGQYGSGIGGGSEGDGGTITINGGTVTATSGVYGAGIGGSVHGAGGTITINGGTVTATSGGNGAGIGAGIISYTGTIIITGGTVTAATGTATSSSRGFWADTIELPTSYSWWVNSANVDPGGAPFNKPPSELNPGDFSNYRYVRIVAFELNSDEIRYNDYDEFGVGPTTRTKDPNEAMKITSDMTTLEGSGPTFGWYYCEGTISLGSLTVTGDVHLILRDGCSLTASATVVGAPGVGVPVGNNLTIYEEQNSVVLGQLIASGNGGGAGIGGASNNGGGTITINGGVVSAVGAAGGAGIGGAAFGSGGTITINGGVVSADGAAGGAGIGSGVGNTGGTFTMNGGVVSAVGSVGGAGIGGGTMGGGGTITINGGTVYATGGPDASGIGSGQWGILGPVTITGGTVTAATGSPATDDPAIRANPLNLPDAYYWWVNSTNTGVGMTPGNNPPDPLPNLTTFFSGDYVRFAHIRTAEVNSDAITYYDYDLDGTPKADGTRAPGEAERISASMTSLDGSGPTGGWYYCEGTLNTGTLTVTGDVHIILLDGCDLTATGTTPADPGIRVADGNSLTIYEQENSGTVGKLAAVGGSNSAGIGTGVNEGTSGTVIINGGTITASAINGAGIGGGSGNTGAGGTGAVVTVNAGTVTASSTNGAGIGGGSSITSAGGNGAVVTINGGHVGATSTSGAGIGGGNSVAGSNCGAGGQVTITGGIVDASSTVSYGIGGGCSTGAATASDLKILAGAVTARSTTQMAIQALSNPAELPGAYWWEASTSATGSSATPVSSSVQAFVNNPTYRYVAIFGDVNQTAIDYLYWDTTDQIMKTATIPIGGAMLITSAATELTDSGPTGGWYYVDGTVNTGTLTIDGDVHIVVLDQATLESTSADDLTPGIELADGNSLSVYVEEGFSWPDPHLIATGGLYGAGIGTAGITSGADATGETAGALFVHGGVITANGTNGAGIGGGGVQATGAGVGGQGGDVTVYDGIVFSKSQSGAGVGGGAGSTDGGDGGTVLITGGEIYAESGTGAGVGGGTGVSGNAGKGGDVTATGGQITAKAQSAGYDIGSGSGANPDGGTLDIDTAGTVRTEIHLQVGGTDADPSIGTCYITDSGSGLSGYYSILTTVNGTASWSDPQDSLWKTDIVRDGVSLTLAHDPALGTGQVGQWNVVVGTDAPYTQGTNTAVMPDDTLTLTGQRFGISLSAPGTNPFTNLVYAATPVSGTVTVTNTGDQATGALTVALSGADAASFVVSTPDLVSIAVSGNRTFTVTPKGNLDVGTYTATVTVAGATTLSEPFSASITVSVTVTQASTTITTAPSAANIYLGQALSASSLTGGSAGGVAGVFAWLNPTDTPTISGSQPITFTPSSSNYAGTSGTAAVTVLDKNALDALIIDAEDLWSTAPSGDGHNQYPQTAKNTLAAAITAASTVAGLPASSNTQTDINTAYINLGLAIVAFNTAKITVDTTDLSLLITSATSMINTATVGPAHGQYTLDDYDEFSAAITTALSVLGSVGLGTTQASIDAATGVLNDAMDFFGTRAIVVDTSALTALIGTATTKVNGATYGLCNGDYDPAQEPALTAAINAATLVAADPDRTPSSITAGIAALQTAINAFDATLVTVDYTALTSQISDSTTLITGATEGNGNGQYPPGSKAVFQAAIDAAQAVADDDRATQAQVDQATSDLAAVHAAFLAGVVKVSYDQLNALVTDAQDRVDNSSFSEKNGDHPVQAGEDLNAAIGAAQVVANNGTASQSQINAAATTLQGAINTFDMTIVTVDYTHLTAELGICNTLIAGATEGAGNGQYAPGSMAILQAAIDTAQAVADNDRATQAEVDQAEATLATARTAFLAGVSGVTYDLLNALITDAQDRVDNSSFSDKNGDHPAQAGEDLAAAIVVARAVANNGTASQSQINAAAATLQGAINTFDSTLNTVDYTALTTQLGDSNTLLAGATEGSGNGQYPLGSKASFQAAIAAAQLVADNDQATQAQVDQAASDLVTAHAVFLAGVVKVTYDQLNTLITDAQDRVDHSSFSEKNGDHPAQAGKDLAAAIVAAQAVANNGTASQSQINAAATILQGAINTFDTTIVTVDYTHLAAELGICTTLIAGATEGAGNGQFTPGSKAVFQAAIDTAQAVADNDRATQAEVNQAENDLRSARTAFLSNVVGVTYLLLNALIEQAQDKVDNSHFGDKNGDYPVAAGEDLAAAIRTAQAVASNGTASQNEINAASTALQNAIDFFATRVNVVHTAALMALIGTAIDKVNDSTYGDRNGDYAPAQEAALTDSIAAATQVAADPDRTPGSIAAGIVALQGSINAFNATLVEVDYAELTTQLGVCNTLLADAVEGAGNGHYTPGSKAIFQAAIDATQMVASNDRATQAEVDQAEADLRAARTAFLGNVVGVTYDLLNALIEQAQDKVDNSQFGDKNGDYPPQAGEDLSAAIQTAQAIAENGAASQDEINAAATALEGLITAFNESQVKVNYQSLIDLIETAKNAVKDADPGEGHGQTPQEAIDALLDIIGQAEQIANNPAVSQADVNQALTGLRLAQLEFFDAPIIVDFTQADDTINEAKQIEQGNYTDESWQVLQNAIANAEFTRSTPNVTQADLDEASQAVINAIAGLTLTLVDPHVDPPVGPPVKPPVSPSGGVSQTSAALGWLALLLLTTSALILLPRSRRWT